MLPVLLSAAEPPAAGEPPAIEPIVRIIDLDVGDTQEVRLADGGAAKVRLLDVRETRDSLRDAVRESLVTVEVNGERATLSSANYQLPIEVGGVQIDSPVTRGYTTNSSQGNPWALESDARLRLWPAGATWTRPSTFGYPLKQRWFASDTQMANEPTFVDGGDAPGAPGAKIYYHYGLDFGGAEGLVEVIAATDGLVVSAAGETLPAHLDSPAKPRYDVIYLVDGRGWYYRYSHLKQIDVRPGQRVRRGEHLGTLGKEGGSGGWSHLHFDITTLQPSGKWGIQDGYAYVWEAYLRERRPDLLAVARPHRLALVGRPVPLDGRKSWSASGQIVEYHWTFHDGGEQVGATAERTYSRPGSYCETLRVTDEAGRQAWDFAIVQVLDPERRGEPPPSIHAAYAPTTDLHPGQEVTFKVRSFRTSGGGERWNFGDGTPPVEVRSDGNADKLSPDGYAVVTHRFARPGTYVVKVEHHNARGEIAQDRLAVHIEP